MAQENNATHWVLGGALLLIGLFVIIAFDLTRSQTETTTVQITQATPTVDAVKLCINEAVAVGSCVGVSEFTGANTTSTEMDLFVQVSDANGYGDIASVGGSLYRSSVGLAACNTGSIGAGSEYDGNSCYSNYDGQTSGGILSCAQNDIVSTTSAWWKCDVTLQYWMDATDPSSNFAAENWAMDAIVVDSQSNTGISVNPSTFRNNTVLSMNFGSSTISYGPMSLGATKAGVSVLGTAQGNSDVDMTIAANSAVMTCDGVGSANIPVANQRFGTSDSAYEALASALSNSPQDLDFEVNVNDNELLARTSETVAPSDTVFFGIGIPASGVSGTCTVAATLAAINH